MGGLVLILVGVSYVLILGVITRLAYGFARKQGYKLPVQLFFVACGFLIPTMLIFWDVIPTKMAYSNYCEKEAGFRILKNPQQWKIENVDIPLTAIPTKDSSIILIGKNRTRQLVNNRLVVETFHDFVFLAVRKFEQRLIDIKTNETLAISTSFYAAYVANNLSPYEGTSGLQSIKVWIREPSCKPSSKYFEELVDEFKDSGKRL
jgi:hypothetical protein